MNITIIGSGYVGLVTGACLAELGNNVACLDTNDDKIDTLSSGDMPIFEPGLQELVAQNKAAGRLSFSSDIPLNIPNGNIHFIAVGTPSDEDGSADLQYVLAAARSLGESMEGFNVIVDKSTVPVGTASKVHAIITEALLKRGYSSTNAERKALGEPTFSVVANPEFLKEGAAVDDFMRPDRIILGVDSDELGQLALKQMRQLYAPFNRHHERTFVMDTKSAEFTKYAANAMLATRISFMNELANLADKVGADIEFVRQGMGSDPRIGYSFLYAGTGYGGSCFPKDVRALMRTAMDCDQHLKILSAVESVNTIQKHILVNKITDYFDEDLSGRCFAIWGLAFKPNTDDMRDAPSRIIIHELIQRGATIRAHDPVAMSVARRCLTSDFATKSEQLSAIKFLDQPMDALVGADALVIVTEWKTFRSPNFEIIKSTLKEHVIFDGRNLYEPRAVTGAGLNYIGIGRRSKTTIVQS